MNQTRTPDRPQKTATLPHSTPTTLDTSNGPLDGYPTAKKCRKAVTAEIKPCTASLSAPKGPNDTDWLEALFRYHGIDDEEVTALLARPELAEQYSDGRWTSIPSTGPEKDLYKPLTDLMNKIFGLLKREGKFNGKRLAIITAFTVQQHEDGHRPPGAPGSKASEAGTKPDILIVGQDQRQLPHPLSQKPTAQEYRRTVVVGDVKLDRESPGNQNDRSQVVMYARYAATLYMRIRVLTFL